MFKLHSEYKPTGDQPKAIDYLVKGIERGEKYQTLLGVTGSGKTFTMANIIEKTQKPTLVLAHNKTLAGQLYSEFKEFFPENHVEYFVSYYDYYQPESYIAQSDTYIEKDASINDEIDKLRHSATASLFDLKEALNYIKMCNQIRAYEGVAPLKVSYYLMSVSAIQNQYSSVNLGHSKLYEVGENLYWSSQDNNSEDFLDKNGNLDVKSLYELGKKPDSFNVQSNNPFYGWWTEEKILYEQTHNIDKAGHYFNIVDKNYTLTGFSHNNQKHNLNMYTWGQVFKDSLKLNNLNGEGQTTITGLTVDEFENTLNSWILKKANGVQIEQDKVDAAKAEVEKATNALNDNKQNISTKQTEISNYKDNVKTQFKTAETTYNNAKNTYDNLVNQQSSVKAELDTTSSTLNAQKDALTKLEDQLKADKKKKDTLSNQITDKKTLLAQKKEELANATKDKAELEQALKDANADVDRITALIDENDKKIKALESEINANQQNINAYNAELNTLNSEVTSKEAEKDALSANIDMLNTAINAYNKQLEECNK